MTKRSLLGLVLTLTLTLGLAGCGSDNPSGPPTGGGTTSGTSAYDGIWVATITSGQHPMRGLRFEVSSGELVHVWTDTVWDLLQCFREYKDTRFDASAGIWNGSVAVGSLSNPPIRIETLSITFSSGTEASGSMSISLLGTGNCDARSMAATFDATRL